MARAHRRTESMMPSEGVRDAMLRFYDRLSASDVASFDSLISGDAATLVIGTAPGEWVTDRARLRFGFEAEGLGIDAGDEPAGYENGDVGWFVDEPTYRFPDGSLMLTRLTAILQREDDAWKIVHLHVSVGVPDEEVTTLQQRWQSGPAGRP
jgi:ketosteroid isomerase-like protein